MGTIKDRNEVNVTEAEDIKKKYQEYTEELYQGKVSWKDGHSNGHYGMHCMDLTEAEDIKKRWQEYTEELYKKDLNSQDNHNGVITHLETDILEYKV